MLNWFVVVYLDNITETPNKSTVKVGEPQEQLQFFYHRWFGPRGHGEHLFFLHVDPAQTATIARKWGLLFMKLAFLSLRLALVQADDREPIICGWHAPEITWSKLTCCLGIDLLEGNRTRKIIKFTPEAQAAFAELKRRFTSTPTLKMPDSVKLFIVEVDASEVGLRVVLSWCHRSPEKLHLCTFLSHKLPPAERNYDIGNR